MPNQHATKSITWHPKDPTLKPWIDAEAGGRGITLRQYMDEVMAVHRASREHASAFRDAAEAETVNREISGHLKARAEQAAP